MFKDEQFYEAKVFLRSYRDAIDCVKESAQKKESLENYERTMNRLIKAKQSKEITFVNGNVQKGPEFKGLREVKLFQFSNFLFQKYLGGFDAYSGEFGGLKNILNDAAEKMRKDVEIGQAGANK